MKQKIFVFLVTILTFSSFNIKADIIITSITPNIGSPGEALTGSGLTGSFTDTGDGVVMYRAAKFGNDMDVFQQTLFMDNTDLWSGTSLQGVFDYDAQITAMDTNQVAVGLFVSLVNFDLEEVAILEIFDCIAGICTGTGIPLQNSTFADGSNNLLFSGTGFANVPQVPVPSAVWLFGSGLIGLVGLARRKKA